MAPKIYVNLKGGFGNQLFQLAASDYFARWNGAQVLVGDAGVRKLAGESLGLRNRLLAVEPGSKFTFVNSPVSRRVLAEQLLRAAGLLPDQARRALSVWGFVVQKEVGFEEFRRPVASRVFLKGYFQSRKYVDQNFGPLRNPRLLLPVTGPSAWLKTRQGDVQSRNVLGVHIRRSDYLDPKNSSIGALSNQYFMAAIDASLDTSIDEIWFFSEDPSEVPPELTGRWGLPSRLIVPGVDPLESLLLMSQCERLVISNSTFSWWAAMLGSVSTVTAPETWFRNLDEPIDILPEHWRTIPSSWLGD